MDAPDTPSTQQMATLVLSYIEQSKEKSKVRRRVAELLREASILEKTIVFVFLTGFYFFSILDWNLCILFHFLRTLSTVCTAYSQVDWVKCPGMVAQHKVDRLGCSFARMEDLPRFFCAGSPRPNLRESIRQDECPASQSK